MTAAPHVAAAARTPQVEPPGRARSVLDLVGNTPLLDVTVMAPELSPLRALLTKLRRLITLLFALALLCTACDRPQPVKPPNSPGAAPTAAVDAGQTPHLAVPPARPAITLDRDKLVAHGIAPGHAASVVEKSFQGKSTITRADLEAVQLRNDQGIAVPLSEVATIEVQSDPPEPRKP